MIRWRRAAVSSSVQSGRMFGSKAFTYVPSLAEGVLDSAERGGYRHGPENRCNASRPEKSTSSPDVWTPSSTRLGDRGARERRLVGLVGNVELPKPNQIAAEHISSRPRRRRLSKSSTLGSAACSRMLIAPSP